MAASMAVRIPTSAMMPTAMMRVVSRARSQFAPTLRSATRMFSIVSIATKSTLLAGQYRSFFDQRTRVN